MLMWWIMKNCDTFKHVIIHCSALRKHRLCKMKNGKLHKNVIYILLPNQLLQYGGATFWNWEMSNLIRSWMYHFNSMSFHEEGVFNWEPFQRMRITISFQLCAIWEWVVLLFQFDAISENCDDEDIIHKFPALSLLQQELSSDTRDQQQTRWKGKCTEEALRILPFSER